MHVILPHAPAVRTTCKSMDYPSAEQAAIRQALVATRGITSPLPVIFASRIVGLVQGRPWPDDRVRFIPMKGLPTPMSFAGYTSYDDIITELSNGKSWIAQWAKTPTTAGVANNWYDLWPVTGNPAGGDYAGTANTARQFDNTTTGAINVSGSVSPDLKYWLSMTAMASANTPTLLIADRVLTYDSNAFTAAASQAMTNTLAAQRYISTGDPGLQVAVVVDTATGATAANLTVLTYVDNDGNTGQTMPTTPTVTFIPSAAAGTTTLGARVIAPSTSGATVSWGTPGLPLASGDTGVRSITDYTTSAANTGTFAFVLFKPHVWISCPVAGVSNQVDQVVQVPGLIRIYDGACIQLFSYQTATTGHTLYGAGTVGWG